MASYICYMRYTKPPTAPVMMEQVSHCHHGPRLTGDMIRRRNRFRRRPAQTRGVFASQPRPNTQARTSRLRFRRPGVRACVIDGDHYTCARWCRFESNHPRCNLPQRNDVLLGSRQQQQRRRRRCLFFSRSNRVRACTAIVRIRNARLIYRFPRCCFTYASRSQRTRPSQGTH